MADAPEVDREALQGRLGSGLVKENEPSLRSLPSLESEQVSIEAVEQLFEGERGRIVRRDGGLPDCNGKDPRLRAARGKHSERVLDCPKPIRAGESRPDRPTPLEHRAPMKLDRPRIRSVKPRSDTIELAPKPVPSALPDGEPCEHEEGLSGIRRGAGLVHVEQVHGSDHGGGGIRRGPKKCGRGRLCLRDPRRADLPTDLDFRLRHRNSFVQALFPAHPARQPAPRRRRPQRARRDVDLVGGLVAVGRGPRLGLELARLDRRPRAVRRGIDAAQVERELVRVGAVLERLVLDDQLVLEQLHQRLVERLHPVLGHALLDDRAQAVERLAHLQHLADGRRVEQDLDRGHAARAAPLGHQALRDDGLQVRRQLLAHRVLLVGLEERQHALHGHRRVGRVQGGEHEVARVGGHEHGLHRLAIADLADQDDVRVLAQDAAQALGERPGVDAHLALVDGRHLVAMEELDRVLDGDDVLVRLLVRHVDQRGQRRRLARAGGAGDEHEPARQHGQLLDRGRHAQVVERRDGEGNGADRERRRAALGEDVAAEAAQAGHAEGEVDLVVGIELGALLGGEELVDDQLEVLRRWRRVAEGVELAVHANERRGRDLDVQVGCARAHHCIQDFADVHGPSSAGAGRSVRTPLRGPRAHRAAGPRGTSGRVDQEQGLSVLHRLTVLDEDPGDATSSLRLDFVHQLHRLDDAHRLADLDRGVHLHVRVGIGRRRPIERADHGREDRDEVGVRPRRLAGHRRRGRSRRNRRRRRRSVPRRSRQDVLRRS